jgi:hypothetical protein
MEQGSYSQEYQPRTAETIGLSVVLGIGLVAISFGAFTRAQKRWIKERDGYACQVPDSNHGGVLHVHHIVPDALLQMQGIEADTPMNGATTCDNHHHIIHKAGNKTFETKNGMVVWGDQWLADLSSRAVENTRKFFIKGKVFPRGEQNNSGTVNLQNGKGTILQSNR